MNTDTIKGYLEPDEKPIYTEQSNPMGKFKPRTILIAVFALFGIPIYWPIIAAAITFAVSGGTVMPDWFELIMPVFGGAMFLVFVSSVARTIGKLKSGLDKAEKTEPLLVITNKRIFFSGVMEAYVGGAQPFMESRFDEALFVKREDMRGQKYIKVKVRRQNVPSEQSPEQTHYYPVKDSKQVYELIPLELRMACGEKSKKGQTEIRRENKFNFIARFVMLVIGAGLAALFVTLMLQDQALNWEKRGASLYKAHRYEEAKSVLTSAYKLFPSMQSDGVRGPTAYRLALTNVALGRPDEAIPLFKDAAVRCRLFEGEDSNKNWEPAIFRSTVHLARIYANKGNRAVAKHYFEVAMKVSDKEVEQRRIDNLVSDYSKYLTSIGETKEAEAVRAAGKKLKKSELTDETFVEGGNF